MCTDKEDIIRHYYKVYGSETQVREVPMVLKKVLVGATEEDNWDLFKIYCDKLKHLHGKCPREVWKEHQKAVANGEVEAYTKWDLLDGYGGSGQLGKVCAKSFKAEDYKLQRGDEIDGLRMGKKEVPPPAHAHALFLLLLAPVELASAGEWPTSSRWLSYLAI